MEARQVAKGGAAAPRTLCLNLVWIIESAATVNGRSCVATPKIVGSEGVISQQTNPGLGFLGFLADEVEAMAKERPRLVRTLFMDPWEMSEGLSGAVYCHP